MSGEAEHDNDDDNVPLHRMKPFGSGLRRNEIKFVPASTQDQDQDPVLSRGINNNPSGKSISDFYLQMVLKNSESATQNPGLSEADDTNLEVCDICALPLTSTPASSSPSSATNTSSRHDASIAHQVCLAHSHPPSALDRRRVGLSILEAADWDPDARTGLGAEGQGVQYPIKVTPKEDRLGLGVVVPRDLAKRETREKPKLLDAKKVRKMAVADRKRTDKMQQQIFGTVDLERYLGEGA